MFVFYIAHFNLFSILMTSQLSSVTRVLHLASLKMNVSVAKEQNITVSQYLKCLQQLVMYNPQQAVDKVC